MNADPYVLKLDDPQAALARAGGKGANLARLAQAGFPVPPAFLVTTAAYAEFVAAQSSAAVHTANADGRTIGPAGRLASGSDRHSGCIRARATSPSRLPKR